MSEFFKRIGAWFNEGNNALWFTIVAAGIVLTIFVILFITKAVKAHKLNIINKSLRDDLSISKNNTSVTTSELTTSQEELLKTQETLNDLRIENASLEEKCAKASEDITTMTRKINDLIFANNSLKDKNDELQKKLDAQEEILEPAVSPEAINDAENVAAMPTAESVTTTQTETIAKPKTGIYKYTLNTLNEIGKSLGLSEKKTKTDAANGIKYTIIDKKATKSQLISALNVIGIVLPASMQTKDKLLDILCKELNK